MATVLGQGACFHFEADFEVAPTPQLPQALVGLRVHVQTASPIVRQAAEGQLRACGAEPVGAADCDVVLVDADVRMLSDPPHGPPALVLLAPEARELIAPSRARGYAGYLIKPLRRASLAERVLTVARPPAVRVSIPDDRDEPILIAAGLRVLLAEDNPVNALLARAVLRRVGCTVDQAGGGEEAVTAALARPYDLILMDMRMPGMNGLEAARAIREGGCRTPMVALTANAFADDRHACLAAGMDGFLTKPLDPKALHVELARLTPPAAERASPSAAAAAMGDSGWNFKPNRKP